jgi:hypothetical protein
VCGARASSRSVTSRNNASLGQDSFCWRGGGGGGGGEGGGGEGGGGFGRGQLEGGGNGAGSEGGDVGGSVGGGVGASSLHGSFRQTDTGTVVEVMLWMLP